MNRQHFTQLLTNCKVQQLYTLHQWNLFTPFNPTVLIYANSIILPPPPVGQDSIVSIVICYELDGPGLEPWGGGNISCICQNWPCGTPSLLHKVYWVIPTSNLACVWHWSPTPLVPKVKKWVELHNFTPPLCLQGKLQGENYLSPSTAMSPKWWHVMAVSISLQHGQICLLTKEHNCQEQIVIVNYIYPNWWILGKHYK